MSPSLPRLPTDRLGVVAASPPSRSPRPQRARFDDDEPGNRARSSLACHCRRVRVTADLSPGAAPTRRREQPGDEGGPHPTSADDAEPDAHGRRCLSRTRRGCAPSGRCRAGAGGPRRVTRRRPTRARRAAASPPRREPRVRGWRRGRRRARRRRGRHLSSTRKPVSPWVDEGGETADGGGDDGRATGRRLERHEAEGLRAARHETDVRRPVVRREPLVRLRWRTNWLPYHRSPRFDDERAQRRDPRRPPPDRRTAHEGEASTGRHRGG